MLSVMVDGEELLVGHCRESGSEQCARCRGWHRECGYDKERGCTELLCNRCLGVMKESYPNHEGYLKFRAERKALMSE